MTMDFLGPWETRIGAADQVFGADGSRICTVMPKHGEAYRHFDADVAIAHLIASAPAMGLALKLIADSHARIEKCGDLREFCFQGIRYCMNGDWNALMAVIGWERALKATGEQPCA